MDVFVQILPFVVIIGVFWLLLIRPQQRRMRELNAMQQALEPGNEVMLTSGIFGTVSEIGDERISVIIADGVTIEVARGAVGQRVPVGGHPTEEAGHPTEEDDA